MIINTKFAILYSLNFKTMKKTRLTNISDFKVGDTIEILSKPMVWSPELNSNKPLDRNLTYPYILTIKEIRRDDMTCGNYGWDLHSIITVGCNKIEIPETWYVTVTEENKDVLFNWRFEDPNDYCELKVGDIVGRSNMSERGHNRGIDTGGFGDEISYKDFKKYILIKDLKHKEMNTERKIIEYKFKNEEFKRAANKIISTSGRFRIVSNTYDVLNSLNLIHIWCDPVYEQEYKEGDYVIVKSYEQAGIGNNVLEDNSICLISDLSKYKELKASGIPFNLSDYLVKKDDGYYSGIKKDHIIRKATDEEIKEFNSLVLPEINGHEGKVVGYYIKYGCASLAINWFTETDNRSITVITLSSGVSIDEKQIEAIRKYLKHNNLFK